MDTTEVQPEKTAKPEKQVRNQRENLERIRQVWPWVFFVVLVVGFSIASKQMNDVNFISYRSVQGILEYATQILLIALAETFIIISAGIDLSVGWTLGFSSVIAAEIMQNLHAAGYSALPTVGLGMLGGILVAIAPGLVNGLLVARIKVPSFIATLGMGILVEGVALLDKRRLPGRQATALSGRSGQRLSYALLARAWLFLLSPCRLRPLRLICRRLSRFCPISSWLP